MSETILAIDLGGTRFRAVTASSDAPDEVRSVGEWPAPQSLDDFTVRIDTLVAAHRPARLGVGIPGLVHGTICRWTPNLPFLDGLDLAARYLNENFRGWTMEDMRAELARRIETERGEYQQLMKSIERLYQQGALASNEGTDVVFVEGAANLVTGEKDRQRLQDMLRTLEEKEKVVKLLSAYLDTRQEAVRVVIGLDQELPSMQNFVLIGAPARVGGEVRGSLAVIGPTRLDYQHTMSAVSYIARLFDKLLNESE